MNVSALRDTIIEKLRGKGEFKNMAEANINGNYFSAADIALGGADGKNEVFRIAVIQHDQSNRFDQGDGQG